MSAVLSRVNKTLIRREFWENRSLWIVPTVVIGLFLFTGIVRLVMMLTGHAYVGTNASGSDFNFNGPDLGNAEPSELAALIRVSPLFIAVPFNGIMLIVVFFYLLDSLYADRRDRSVLFWRSMPVSDVRTVLVKLATGIFAATAITFAAVIVTQLLTILLGLVSGGMVEHPGLLLTHPLAMLEGWCLLAYALIAQSIWFLPYYGWWMLASAWARRAPLLWALLPPAMLIIMEGIVFQSAHFWHLISHHLLDWLGLIFNFDPIKTGESGRELMMNGDFLNPDGLARFLSSPEMWTGLLLGAAFIYGAIWLRRNRSEI
ncbi:MAG: hypothetical protein ACHQAZ_08065 [Gammaproteobacteria bacterium]